MQVDPITVLDKDAISKVLFLLDDVRSVARLSAVSRGWRAVISRHLSLLRVANYQGSIWSATRCTLSHVREVRLQVSGWRQVSLERGVAFDSLRGCERFVATLEEVEQRKWCVGAVACILAACPALRWLEVDSTQDVRGDILEAQRLFPDRLARLEVAIVGTHESFFAFRGVDNKECLERVWALHQPRPRRFFSWKQPYLFTFLAKLLNREDWASLAPQDTSKRDLIDALETMTRAEGAHCPGRSRPKQRCFAWFECYGACNLMGDYGLCYYCATHCHKDHLTFLVSIETLAYCDCTLCEHE